MATVLMNKKEFEEKIPLGTMKGFHIVQIISKLNNMTILTFISSWKFSNKIPLT